MFISLKKIRKDRGLTQVQVAELLGITQTSVAAWECGKSYPCARLIPKLAELYDVTISELYGEPPTDEHEMVANNDEFTESSLSDFILSKQEQDLLRIYNSVDGRTQTQIMQFVYGLEETL